MMSAKYYIWILLLISPPAALCQNIAAVNLEWAADHTTDLRTDASASFSCTFITNGTEGVTWLQKNGEISTAFSVTGTEGTWTNVASQGTFTYQLTRDGKSGFMTVEKNGEGTFITLDFSESGAFAIKRRFRIASVTEP